MKNIIIESPAESPISTIILAGGFGTRMKSKIPKVMHKICGKEMLFCIIDEVAKLSDDIHIVLYNEADLIKNAICKQYGEFVEKSLHLHLQDYKNYPGTAGAIMQGAESATPKAPIATKYEKILILSGDMPLIRAESLQKFAQSKSQIALGILELENTTGYGRVVMNGDKVSAIVEEKDADSATKAINLANAGIYCLNRALLESALPRIDSHNNQREFYLTDIIKFSDDICGIVANECDFMGVNSKVELAKAEGFALERLRDSAMKQGVIFHLPHTIYLEFGVEFEGECEIENGAVLKGKSKIIHSKILAHSVVESSEIAHSTIGPFARIRPHSLIKHSHIGNFVEVKNSHLMDIKAGHLSYLGDSEVQSGTNIGAGVITCNYDGKNKHKSFIGKNVFVGSGTQLVAPIYIENNVLIAAGSVVTSDAKDGDLVVARAKQVNKAGFFYRFFGGEK
ncbi:bifunctional UDP-N-acetylglucosamine diphosphorylase/glucosamine-1-phosphate N-acetyltransferase GlmU [Helicobacter sp. 23-1045]